MSLTIQEPIPGPIIALVLRVHEIIILEGFSHAVPNCGCSFPRQSLCLLIAILLSLLLCCLGLIQPFLTVSREKLFESRDLPMGFFLIDVVSYSFAALDSFPTSLIIFQ